MFGRRSAFRGRGRARVTGRGAYYYKPSPAFLAHQSRNISGKGNYISDVWNKYRKYVPRALGAVAGHFSGTGAKAGYDAGGEFSKNILGWGAYRTGGKGKLIQKGNIPSMHRIENGIRISHKECIGTLVSTTGFSVNTYEVNPGLNSTFPWLSNLARCFQQYTVNGLIFLYKPTCSDAISSATIASMGSISMSSDMNVAAVAPIDTIGMLSNQFSASAKPSQEIVMSVEQSKRMGGASLNTLLVRNGDVPTSGNKQFYDDCVVFISTDANGVAGATLGQLFISYDISFYSPASITPGSGNVSAHYRITTAATASVFGTSAATFVKVFDTVGVNWTSANLLTLDVGNTGKFMIIYNSYDGAAAANITGGAWTFAGGAVVFANMFTNGTANYHRAPNAITSIAVSTNQSAFTIPRADTAGTIALVQTFATDPDYVDLFIVQIDQSMT